jgi:hypothetical protein
MKQNETELKASRISNPSDSATEFWDRPPWDDHEQTRSTRRECLIAAKPKTSNHGPNHGPNLGPCLRLGDDGDMTEI